MQYLSARARARARARTAFAIAVSIVLGTTLAVAVATPASASSFVLCKGYSSCQAYGMPTHGYSGASKSMYWRMYSGHNCTNYAAYLMIKAGMSSTRPWVGNGGANGWGIANKSRTNSTPVAGSIAWWSSGNGHVAYVEAVLSPTQILISEDNWGGDFYWKILTKDGAGWPRGFIHFRDSTTGGSVPDLRGREYSQTVYTDSSKSALANTTIMKPGSTAWVELRVLNTGTATWAGLTLKTVGAQPSAIDGGWTSPATIAVQSEPAVAPGTTATFGFAIRIPDGLADATPVRQQFVPVTTDGLDLPRSTVHFSVTADSRDVFTQTPAPTITGTSTEGNTLTAEPGAWKPSGATLAYQWKRNGAAVAGATTPEYVLTDADVGRRLTVTVTATAPNVISATTTSLQTPLILSAWPNSLAIGQSLQKGQQIVAINGMYRAYQRLDGSLIVQNRLTGTLTWSNKVKATDGYSTLTDTGELATYNGAGQRLWTSGAKVGATVAYITSSGKLQLRTQTGTVLWSIG